MSSLARQWHMRYSFRMTELNPLEYAASAGLLIPLTAWAAALNGSKGALLRRKAWPLVGWLVQTLYWLAGCSLGVLTLLVYISWAWMDLWAPPVAAVLRDWWNELDAQRPRSYQPRHANAMA